MNTGGPRLVFRIHGMDCAEEVGTLKRALGPLVGGEDQLTFDILNGKVAILAGGVNVSADEFLQAVERTGMRAEVWQDDADGPAGTTFWQQHGRALATAASGIFGLMGFIAHAAIARGFAAALGSEGMAVTAGVPPLSIGFYLIGITAGVWFVLPKAWRAALSFRPDMNLLMTIAVVGAASIGEWFEAATASLLFSVSLLLES